MSSTPPKNGERTGTTYARFIPREELRDFAAWTPDAFGGTPAHTPEARQPDSAQSVAEALQAQLHAARQAGYQDGYRDGLVALDGFKRSFAQQTTAQVGALLQRFDDELLALERQLAHAVARAAVELARQVVRSELATRPELVVKVAEDALGAVLLSARHIVVHVHPDDHDLVAQGAAEVLAARAARLVATADVERGGCRIESELGRVDAQIGTRWAQAAATLGQDVPWRDAAAADETEGRA
jgi:flagellar assembly protein FliH